MLMLGVAPIIYGHFLQAVSARNMLRITVALLAVTNLTIPLITEFWLLLTLRTLQGLLLPAIFTALMTYCSSIAPPGKVRQYMAYYIATTILGGFFGRALSGALSTWFDWSSSFLVLGVTLLLNGVLLRQLSLDAQSEYVRPDPRAIISALKTTQIRYALLTTFSFFFVFSGLLNTLPFRMVALSPTISELSISAIYLGYLIGAVIALGSGKILSVFGGQTRTLRIAFATCFVTLMLLPSANVQGMAVLMLTASAGFFLLHTLMSGFVNHVADGKGGVVNGLYVSFYYAGGSLGAWLLALVYRDFGWHAVVASMFGLLLVSFLCARRLG